MLLSTCSAVFLFQLLLGLEDGRHPITMASFLFHGTFILKREALLAGMIWQPFTHMFLHGSLLHFIFNMLVLGNFGPWLERAVGSLHFLGIFVLGGIVSGLAQVAVYDGGLLGASGGISALILALVSLQPRAKMWLLAFFVIPIRLRARTLGLGLILSYIFFIVAGMIPFLRPISLPGLGHVAHLGGALFGLFYVRVFLPDREDGDRPYGLRDDDEWTIFDEDEDDPPAPRLEQPVPASRLGAPAAPLTKRRPTAATVAGLRNYDPVFEALLDKVARDGLDSLSPAEQRQLERGAKNS